MRVSDPLILSAILMATALLMVLAWVFRAWPIISASGGRSAAGVRKWIPAVTMFAAIMAFSTAYFSAANTFDLLAAPIRLFAPAASHQLLSNFNLIARRGAHLSIYGLFFLIVCNGPLRRHRFVALGLCLAVAVIDEFHQSLIPERTGLVSDVVFDFAGAFIANLADLAVRGIMRT